MPLRDWVLSSGLSLDTAVKATQPHTHRFHLYESVDGVALPAPLVERALQEWASEIADDVPEHSVVEVLTDPFRFFLTVRLPAATPVAPLLTVMRGVLRLFVPEAPEAVGLCRVAMSRPCGEGTVLLRVVWPGLLVDTVQALTMRERLVAELSERDAPAEEPNDCRWHEMLDYARYTAGVELPGSPILEPCPACDGVRGRRTGCVRCSGRGVVRMRERIMPLHSSHGDGRIEPLNPSDVPLLVVRVEPGSAAAPVTWVRPPGTPFVPMERGTAQSAPRVYPGGNLRDFGAVGGPVRRRFTPLPATTVKMLQVAIRSAFAEHHSRVIVTSRSVFVRETARGGKRYYVTPVGIGCHSCCKFRGEHRDSRIYFCVSANGVEQGCYSQEALPGGVACSTRQATPEPISRRTRDFLFAGLQRDLSSVVSVGGAITPGFTMAVRVYEHHLDKLSARTGRRRKRNVYGD